MEDDEDGFDQALVAVEGGQNGKDGFDQIIEVGDQGWARKFYHHDQDLGCLGADFESVEFQRHSVNEVVSVFGYEGSWTRIRACARHKIKAAHGVPLESSIVGSHALKGGV